MLDHPIVAQNINQRREPPRERAPCTPVDMARRHEGAVKIQRDLGPVAHGTPDPPRPRLTRLRVKDFQLDCRNINEVAPQADTEPSAPVNALDLSFEDLVEFNKGQVTTQSEY